MQRYFLEEEMNTEYTAYMEIAFQEACRSLQEGNHGFGVVIIDSEGTVVSQSHDTEKTECDPTLHAEITAISKASKVLGHDLTGCSIISTHEPCPMCATAIYWSGIRTVVYGYPIDEALNENRKRLDIRCAEIFARANADVIIIEKVMYDRCSKLYRNDIRNEIRKIRNRDTCELEAIGAEIKEKRIQWFHENSIPAETDVLMNGYRVLLSKLGIDGTDAPIVEKSRDKIVFHSMNYCPTLEACILLGYDTRVVCKHMLEDATNCLVGLVNEQLVFTRNYEKMRPYYDFCEEMICLKRNKHDKL